MGVAFDSIMSSVVVIAILCSALVADIATAKLTAARDDKGATMASQFAQFKRRNQKVYATAEEEARRAQIFAANVQRAKELQALNPHATFGADSPFADRSPEEFKVRHSANEALFENVWGGRRGPEREESAPGKAINPILWVDWRKKGAVTYVKNQGECGSCWAFSTTGTVEGQWFLRGNPLTPLSEQLLVSCDKNDLGCGGGIMASAMNWTITKNQGIFVTEASYPYVSANGAVPMCRSPDNEGTFGAFINNYTTLAHDEQVMATWVGTHGPLSVAVDATSWQMYNGGIMTDCQANRVDHGVLIVGYDMVYEPPYWIVKNSWGPTWGESGYIRVAYGSNQCLINKFPTTATVGTGPHPTLPPKPTTPQPTIAPGTFVQSVCTTSTCGAASCVNHTYPLNQCLVAANRKGSLMVKSCSPSTGLEMLSFWSSLTCGGSGDLATKPVEQCYAAGTSLNGRAANGDVGRDGAAQTWLVNYCLGGGMGEIAVASTNAAVGEEPQRLHL